MWGYRTCRVAGVCALRALVWPSHPHVGLLFRVWATPHTCGTGGPRAGRVGVQVVVARGQSAFVLVVDGCTTPSIGTVPLLIGCVAPNGCSASRVTAALPIVQVPGGGGPPARSPHASLWLGVVDLEARPGPAAAPGHRFCPRVLQLSLLFPSEPGGCCGGMRQAVAVLDRCGIAK